jgi:hypothetical protein
VRCILASLFEFGQDLGRESRKLTLMIFFWLIFRVPFVSFAGPLVFVIPTIWVLRAPKSKIVLTPFSELR